MNRRWTTILIRTMCVLMPFGFAACETKLEKDVVTNCVQSSNPACNKNNGVVNFPAESTIYTNNQISTINWTAESSDTQYYASLSETEPQINSASTSSNTYTSPTALNDGSYTLYVWHRVRKSDPWTPYTKIPFVVDTIAPSVASITSMTTAAAYASGSAIDIQVNFNEAVTVTGNPVISLNDGGTATYVSGSKTSTLVFTHTVASGNSTNGNSLDPSSISALTTGGTINDLAGNAAILTLPIGATSGALPTSKSIIIEGNAPVVTNVNAATTDGYYKAGQTIAIEVTFSDIVTVTGLPKLALATGATPAVATYASGSGTNKLTFNYVIGGGDNASDLNYDSIAALTLNGGTIKKNSLNAILTLPALVGATSLSGQKNIVIDTTNPTMSFSSIAPTSPSSSLTPTVTIQLSEPSQTNGLRLYSDLTCTTPISAATTGVAGSNSIITNSLTANATNPIYVKAVDLAGNSSACVSLVGYVHDNIPATVSNVTSSTANGSYKAGQSISIQISFTEAVNVTGIPQLTLNTSDVANYVSGTGTSTLTLTYIIGANQNNGDLDYGSTTALGLNGGTIKDSAGNNATLTLASPGAANSLGANKSIVIDSTAPTITYTSISPASPGSNQTPTLTFSLTEASTVTLYSDSACSSSISSATGLTTGAGKTITTNTLTANTATSIYAKASDVAGNLSTCTNFVSYTHDGVAPTVTNVTSSTADGTYKAGQTVSIQIVFSEIVTVSGIPQLTLETGISDAVVSYTSGSGSTTLTFTYTVGAGENSTDLDYVSTSALALNGGSIKDSATNNATLTLASPGALKSLGNNKNLVIDTTAPTVTSPSFTTSSPGRSQTPTIGFTLSEAATVTLYSNSGCSTAISAASSLGSGIRSMTTNSLTANSSTDIYAMALDNVSNASACTSIGTYVNDLTAPGTPTGLTLTASSGQVDVSWTASTGTPSGYIVVRRASSSVTFTPSAGTTYSTGTQGSDTIVYAGSSTSYSDTGLSNGTTYYYAVFAKDQALNWSSSATGNASPAGTQFGVGCSVTGNRDATRFKAKIEYSNLNMQVWVSSTDNICYQLANDTNCTYRCAVYYDDLSSSGNEIITEGMTATNAYKATNYFNIGFDLKSPITGIATNISEVTAGTQKITSVTSTTQAGFTWKAIDSSSGTTTLPMLSSLSVVTNSPGGSQTPTIKMDINTNSTAASASVTLYSNNTCTTAISTPTTFTTGSARTMQTNSLSLGSTTTIYAQGSDGGWVTNCWSAGTYTQDSSYPVLTSSFKNSSSITINWGGGTPNFGGYRYSSADCSGGAVTLFTAAPITSFTSSPLPANTTYSFKVTDSATKSSNCLAVTTDP